MNQNEIAKIAGITLKHPLMIFMREISIAGNYRFRVIVACATLELFITTLVKHHCKKHGGKFAKSPFERKLLLLHEMGILSDNRFRLLNLFRDLRNDAAHEPKFEITMATLQKFPITIKTPHEHEIVFHICAKMAFELWNEHSNVLARYFFTEQERKES